ncbi:MAG: CBS domain-containing protein, partial [Nitrospira sp.]|nr:CBS domain-containing protein [Nitrospira sp.]
LRDAWEMMTQKEVHHIPVTSVHDILVGMISDRDLLSHVPNLMADPSKAQGTHQKLAEVMAIRVISATPTTDIREIAGIMLEERIHAVPILDGTRRLVGILSARDLLRGIATRGPLELWT